jgi:hypothetical protein
LLAAVVADHIIRLMDEDTVESEVEPLVARREGSIMVQPVQSTLVAAEVPVQQQVAVVVLAGQEVQGLSPYALLAQVHQ